jgi:hypothetical protein
LDKFRFLRNPQVFPRLSTERRPVFHRPVTSGNGSEGFCGKVQTGKFRRIHLEKRNEIAPFLPMASKPAAGLNKLGAAAQD